MKLIVKKILIKAPLILSLILAFIVSAVFIISMIFIEETKIQWNTLIGIFIIYPIGTIIVVSIINVIIRKVPFEFEIDINDEKKEQIEKIVI